MKKIKFSLIVIGEFLIKFIKKIKSPGRETMNLPEKLSIILSGVLAGVGFYYLLSPIK